MRGVAGFFTATRWARALLVSGACAGAASLFLPPGALRIAILNGVGLAAVFTAWMWAAPIRNRTAEIWKLLAFGASCWLVLDVVRQVAALSNSPARPHASWIDLVGLAGYGVAAFGYSKIVHRRAPGRASGAILDGVSLATIAALTVWLLLVQPSLDDSAFSLQLSVSAYAFGDIILLTAMLWLTLLPGRRTRGLWLLVAWIGVRFATDVTVSAWALSGGAPAAFAFGRALHPVGFALLPLAIAYTDRETFVAADEFATDHRERNRVVLLGCALMTAPVIAVVAQWLLPGTPQFAYLFAAFLVSGMTLRRLLVLVRERATAMEQLANRATHDPLTRLPNRVLLVDRLEQAMHRSARRGTPLAVLYIDLDRFKAVNDTWGHRAGDELLERVAQRLVSVVRPGDTVARLAGDEFAVICEDTPDSAIVFGIADRIVAALEHPFEVAESTALVSASVGIAMRGADAHTAEDMLRHADAAMYRAKSAGRDRWEVFDTELEVWVDQRREIETALEHALRNDELRLVYQPVIGLESNAIVGFEALLRWRRPGHGLVTPDCFIGHAEETGLIVPIGEWVLHEACAQLARWQRRFGQPDLHMAVNVSARQLRQPHLAHSVAEAVAKAQIEPSTLVLEITESMLLEESERSLAQLEALKRVGVQLALDDFGTGYSGLSYLRQYPVDIVKIDRSFVGRLGEHADAAVVSAIVQLAHALGLTVVAEGVETDSHLSTLRVLSCDYGQGFLWARPMPPGDAGALVDAPRRGELALGLARR